MMRFRSFWPAVFWSVAILVLSFMPGKSFPAVSWMDWLKLDKWIHAFLYFILFLLIYIPVNERKKQQHQVLIAVGCFYCFFLGLFTELVQGFFLTDRSGDLPDMVANVLGVVLAIGLVRLIQKKWPWNASNE